MTVDAIKALQGSMKPARETMRRSVDEVTALGLSAEDFNTVILAAVTLKEYGAYDGARQVLKRADAAWPDLDQVVYETIQVERLSGNMAASDQILATRFDRLKDKDGFAKDFVGRILTTGRTSDQISIGLASALIKYIKGGRNGYFAAALEYAFHNVDPTERTTQYLAGTSLLREEEAGGLIARAVEARTPFCLLRIGDGEGAVLQNLREAPGALCEGHMSYFVKRWFGRDDAATRQRVLEIAADIKKDLGHADLLGIPPWPWIAGEMKRRNVRTYVNCLEAVHAVREMDPQGRIPKADVSICTQMEGKKILSQIARQAGTVNLVTSRANLPGLLQEKLGITVATTHIIPPPASDPEERAGELPRGGHLFEAYDQIRAGLKDVKRGDVYFVAAGFLGKRYALDVKLQGGIAIDIGYVADLWTGFKSRPEARAPNIQL